MLKKLLKGLVIFLLVFVLIAGGLMTFVLLGKDKAVNLNIEGIKLENVSDGDYTGNYSDFRFSNTVKVSVKDHKITNIKVIKPQIFAREETIKKITDLILEKQNISIDAVSGATADTNAFLKAVENALSAKN